MERMTPDVALQLWKAIFDYGEAMRTGSHIHWARSLCDMREEFHKLTGHKPCSGGDDWAIKTVINTTAPLN